MGILEDLGKNLVEGLNGFEQSLKDKLEAKKREYYKYIFFKNVLLDKKYSFDLKVEENKLTFTNFSASTFFRTLHNSPVFFILFAIAVLSLILIFINKESVPLFFIMTFVASILSIISICSVFKTRAYFTITPQGIEVKTNKSKVFIDRDNIADIYLDIHGASNESVVTSSSDEHSSIIFSVYLKTLQSFHLPDLKKDKDVFDLFISDYRRLSKLFIIVLLTESKKILNLPIQNECFETGFQNVNILREDDSVFIFEKKDKVKVTVDKYKVKIEENAFFGQKKERDISIQNNFSFIIFENIKQGHKMSSSIEIGGIRMEQNTYIRASSDFGLALCENFNSNKPNRLVDGLNLDEAVYILRKINNLRMGNSF